METSIMKTTTEFISEVDLWSRYKCHKLFSRDIWQLIFNEYRRLSTEEEATNKYFNKNSGLNHMDNMLVDFQLIMEEMDKSKYDLSKFKFWWKCYPLSAQTNIRFEEPEFYADYDYHGYFVIDSHNGVFKFVLEKLTTEWGEEC